jgi:hypothetical protein
MSNQTPPTAQQNVAQLTLQLHRTVQEYGRATDERAKAKVAYKNAHAKHRLRRRESGDAKSQAEADMYADADDFIAELHLKFLIAESIADRLKHEIEEIKERVGFGRSVMADQREADRLLATNREIT